MSTLRVICPKCAKYCHIPLMEDDFIENSAMEGFEWQCPCGCSFSFDAYVEINNKEIKA